MMASCIQFVMFNLSNCRKRLHIGHSYSTHSFVIKKKKRKKEEPPVCVACNTILTLRQDMSDVLI